jgi:hypothetical protein
MKVFADLANGGGVWGFNFFVGPTNAVHLKKLGELLNLCEGTQFSSLG